MSQRIVLFLSVPGRLGICSMASKYVAGSLRGVVHELRLHGLNPFVIYEVFSGYAAFLLFLRPYCQK